MAVVAARLYRAGRLLADCDDLTRLALPKQADDLLWVGLQEPHDAEMAAVASQLKFHPLSVEDALNGRQLPKLEQYPGHLFIVACTADWQGDHIHYGETAMFVGDRFIITARHGNPRDHAPVRTHLEAAPDLLSQGSDYVLHAILDYIVDGYMPVMDAIEEKVLSFEDRALDAFLSRGEIGELFQLRRELMRFQRRIEPMEDVLAKLAHLEMPHIDKEARAYFRDIEDHVRRLLHRATDLRDVLSGVFETSGLLEQQRQGTITRQLAAWAAILAVPTAIAGIYGMNFKFMPELEWRYGYFVAVGVMASICIALYIRFKRAGWL